MTRTLTTIRHGGHATRPNNPPADLYRAARSIASHARDADDCAELLEALGLTAADGLAPASEGSE